ncbi:MAG: hypothetical protein KDD66_13760 [Bdellovibrionales bacterium]|nr:hypothetical protein [Bdellovibrionales bacterium]
MRSSPSYGSLILIILILSACGIAVQSGDIKAVDLPEEEQPELSTYMISLQRFSQKLGYSIAERNTMLSLFYVEELEETVEDLIKEVPEHHGAPIAPVAQSIMVSRIDHLEKTIATENWPAVDAGYTKVIDGCNSCHQATQHEFIKILPADTSRQPYNQDFRP